jgi:hypothetical protein
MVYLPNISAKQFKRKCMKNRLSKILLITLLLALLLAACQSSKAEEGPVEAYWAYYEYCENKQFESAEKYLDEEARAQIESIGVCGFTHDAINRIEANRAGAQRVFSDDPETNISDNSAVMNWIDDQGFLASVFLVKTEDGWKVAYTIWST